jgi:hypothetical protein
VVTLLACSSWRIRQRLEKKGIEGVRLPGRWAGKREEEMGHARKKERGRDGPTGRAGMKEGERAQVRLGFNFGEQNIGGRV